MRINVETFLALTVLMGTGVAVGVGVMSIRDRKADETASAAAADVEETPVAATPEPAKVEPVVTAPVVTPPVVPVVPAAPPLEPELIPDDESSYIPGPMVES
jgi:hypothetical protein